MGITVLSDGPRKRTHKRRRSPYSWLGAGAIAFGVGAAALAGAGAAYADETDSGSHAASSPGSGNDASEERVKSTEPQGLSDTQASSGANAGSESSTPNALDGSDEAIEDIVADDADVHEATKDIVVDDARANEAIKDIAGVISEGETSTPGAASKTTPASLQPSGGGKDSPGLINLPAAPVANNPTPQRHTLKGEGPESPGLSPVSTALAAPNGSIDPNIATSVNLGAYFPESIATSPDGRYVYAGTGTMNLASGSVVVIDAATNTVKKTIVTNFVVTGIAVAPNGRVYAAGFRTVGEMSALGMVAVISASHSVSKTINLGAATSYSMPVAVTPDGKSVVVGWGTPTSWGVGYVGALTTISTSTQRVTRTVTFNGSVADVALTPNGATALVAVRDTYPATLMKVDLASGATTAISLESTADVRSVAITPGGVFAFVALGNSNDDIAIVQISTGEVLDTFDAGPASSAEHIRLAADGKTLFATEGNVMHTVDVQSRTTLDTLTVGPGVHYYSSGLAVSRNGRVYLSSLYDSSVAVVKLYAANAAPIVAVTVGNPSGSSGVVKGAVTAFDPNGNAVTFSASVPGKGKLALSRTGEFTYTPTASARHAAAAMSAGSTAKTDTFSVTVSNGAGGATTVLVAVVVDPVNKTPTASASVKSPDAATGVVTGKITGRDADRDGLSYSASAPDKGSVVINNDGTFTYTPTSAARHAAGSPGAKSALKTDGFSVTVSDGHGGSKTISVSVKVEPRKLTTSASNLFSAMDPYTPDKLTAQLVSASGGKKRMVVYMTGIDGFFNNPDSAIVGLLGNTGWLNPIVSSFIDGAVAQWKPEEIMLVGFSNGGQQMQNYAGWSANANTKLVKSLVLFGAPLTKKADELQNASSLSILDLNDLTAANLTHVDAGSSYLDNTTDSREIYGTVTALQGDTHNQGTYVQVAKKLDEDAAKRRLPAKAREIYSSWTKFGGTIIDEKIHKIT